MSSPFRLQPRYLLFVGVALAAIAYGRALAYDFIYDDFALIVLNPSLDHWRDWTLAFTQHIWAFFHPPLEPRHYRPLYVLWLLLNKQLFGGVAPWWHLTSFLLHLGNTVLVHRLTLRISHEQWSAALAAVLFALHPVHIEAVVWITASSDLLTTFFLLLSFLWYLRYRDARSSWALAASLAFAAAAALCKETAMVYPLLILGYELVAAPSSADALHRRFGRALPFIAAVLLVIVARKMALPPPPAGFADVDLGVVLSSLPLVALAYARTLVAPFGLSFFYPPQSGAGWDWLSGLALLVLVAGLIGLYRLALRLPSTRLPLTWLCVFAFPPLAAVAVFNRDNWVHDRHMYLPSVGFCLLAAMLLMRLQKVRVRVFAGSVVIVLLTMGLWVQVPRFTNEVALYEHAIRQAPTNIELRLAYAQSLAMYGRPDDSLAEYERITRIAPDSIEAFAILGRDYEERGRYQEALGAFSHALELARPGTSVYPRLLFHLGSVELRLGELSNAESHLRKAVQVDPNGWNYHATLAEVLRAQGRQDEAAEQIRREQVVRRSAIASRVPR